MRALALVEHVDRELDVLCLVRTLLKNNCSITLDIANVSADAPPLLRGPIPNIVFFSSFYSAEWAVRRDYVSAWPNTKMVNLAWEQIFCPIDEPMHRPLDRFSRERIYYLAWSTDYRDFLVRNGVDKNNIEIVGHSLYQLYQSPWSDYFQPRSALAQQFDLNVNKRWVFIPENYGFMHLTDSFIDVLTSGGMDRQVLLDVRAYCKSCMADLVQWADALAKRDDTEVIFRPRPSADARNFQRFFRETCNLARPSFRFLKAETVREWVLASDVVMSSYSTVLVEAAVAGKIIRKVEPKPIPEYLLYEWYNLVDPVTSQEELINAADPQVHDGGSQSLRNWAMERFFTSGFPISRLIEAMASLITAAHEVGIPNVRGPYKQLTPGWLAAIDPFLRPRARNILYRKYVPEYAHSVSGHDKDFFDLADVTRRSRRWEDIVNSQPSFHHGTRPNKKDPGAAAVA